MQCGCLNCCLVVKVPANAIMQRKQRQLGQKTFWHGLQNWLLRSHPWPNMNEQCTNLPNESKIIIRHWNQFCYIFFQVWEIWSQTRDFFFFFFLTHIVHYVDRFGVIHHARACIVLSEMYLFLALALKRCANRARYIPYTGWPKTKRNSRFFRTLLWSTVIFFAPCWIEHLFLIVITPRSSNSVENFLFYE